MNFAILRKVRVLPGISADELIEQVKHYITQARLPGMIEVVFYLSADNPQEIYVVSFWWNLQDLEASREVTYHVILPQIEGKGLFLEIHIFQLLWDFRRLPQPGQASVLRLMILPDKYSEAWSKETILAIRRDTLARPNVRATWLGRSPSNPRYMMHRTDWDSLQAQQNYFSSSLIQNSIAISKANGIILNYASFDLRGVLLPQEVLEE